MVSAPGAPVHDLWLTFLPGLPRFMFKAVAAHELTHAWSYLHGCPLKQDLALSEGAAMFVEYTYVHRDTSPRGQYLCQQMVGDRHPAYGGGLRRLLRYAKGHHQMQGVLAALKTRRTIPSGY